MDYLASKYLWIRNNNIFYFIIELDKYNNKRKYFDRKFNILLKKQKNLFRIKTDT